MKPGNPPLQSIRVLDQLRERIRYMHYSLGTEQVYVYWVRFFIRWSGKVGQMRHPHGARVAVPLKRFHHDDLHPCAQGGCGRHLQSIGCTRQTHCVVNHFGHGRQSLRMAPGLSEIDIPESGY